MLNQLVNVIHDYKFIWQLQYLTILVGMVVVPKNVIILKGKKNIMCRQDDSKCFIKFIPNFFFVVSFSFCHHIDLFSFFMSILNWCFNFCWIDFLIFIFNFYFKFHDHIELLLSQFLVKWMFWFLMTILNYYCLNFSLNFYFNSLWSYH